MSTVTTVTAQAESLREPSAFPVQLAAQSRTELKRLVRNGRFIFFTLAFPALFYLLLVHVFASEGGTLSGLSASAYTLVSMTAYGVMGAGLNLFGTRLAVERSQGWMQLLRTTPGRASATLLARWFAGLVFSAAIVVIMLALGASQGVRLPVEQWLVSSLVLWLGALPFSALGLALGYWIDARSGQVISMVIYFFLSIFGGLWWPIEIMPEAMRRLATYLPSYHYAHLARLAMTHATSLAHVGTLAGYTVAFLLLAWIGWRRDEGRVYA